MRYATIVFMRVLSGLLSGGIILPERRNVLIQAWKEASGSQDSQKAKELLHELLETSEGRLWREDLLQAIESL